VDGRWRRRALGRHELRSRLDLLFFGTGNASTWYRALRGEGDSLYTASILAVKASTGELAWHFQTTPGDSFDYDATQPLIQASTLPHLASGFLKHNPNSLPCLLAPLTTSRNSPMLSVCGNKRARQGVLLDRCEEVF
jgi:hypothetical protein